MPIHPTAVIDPQAELDSSVQIDPYVIIDGPVVIGPGTRICAHAVLSGHTTIGQNNTIGAFTSIGAPPQDLHYKGEATELIIGDGNLVREYVSIHRGTASGRGKTWIGNHNMIMAYCHIAHDCFLADHVIMANLATLAGHVEIGSHANLGGLVAVHQYCRIGDYAYVGGLSGIGLDVPPYVLMEGTRNQMRISGINKIGLRRAGMDRGTIANLEDAFRILFRSPQTLLKDALFKLQNEMKDCPEVQVMVDFFQSSRRGVAKRTTDD
ncbi:MAG: acyl-ACP--UDP-N-acetylglucosamine O-acyltransferase [Desulfobulbaceae bacterium]|nr:acyl-ACP--UDP-N-acetylglucosamine O-acyltransferase [Desulfobulbaceae bacterium]